MKVSQLKSLIKEAVKEAIAEELKHIAPAPAAPSNSTLQEALVSKTPPPAPKATGNPILDAMNMTKHNMTNEDYRSVINADSSMVTGGAMSQAGPTPGLDLSQLDFAKKAGAIYKKSNELDKNKYGL